MSDDGVVFRLDKVLGRIPDRMLLTAEMLKFLPHTGGSSSPTSIAFKVIPAGIWRWPMGIIASALV